jgi:hypothetical protein
MPLCGAWRRCRSLSRRTTFASRSRVAAAERSRRDASYASRRSRPALPCFAGEPGSCRLLAADFGRSPDFPTQDDRFIVKSHKSRGGIIACAMRRRLASFGGYLGKKHMQRRNDRNFILDVKAIQIRKTKKFTKTFIVFKYGAGPVVGRGGVIGGSVPHVLPYQAKANLVRS